MKKAFITNLLFLIAANLLIKPFYLFGIERNVQFLVGNHEYGYYYNLFNFTLILQFINDFGLQNYTSRFISQVKTDAISHSRTLFQLKMILSLIYFVLTLLFAWIWYGSEIDISFVIHLCLNQVLISLIFFLRSNMSGLGLYSTDSFFSILDRFLLIILMSSFCFIPSLQKHVSIGFFVNVQTISLFICTVAALLILTKHNFKLRLGRIDSFQVFEVFKYCIPFALIYLTTGLFMKADTIWIENILEDGKAESGKYASCFRLYEALSIVSLSFGGLLLAMFSRLFDRKQELYDLLNTAFILLYVITLGLSFTGIFYSLEINQLLNKNSDSLNSQLIFYLSLAFIPGSLNFILGAYYQATHREYKILGIYFICGVLSIILNYVFLPSQGILVSAIIYFIIQSILFLLSLILLPEELKHLTRKFLTLLFFSMGLLTIYFIMYFCLNLNYWLEWFIIGLSGLILINLLKIMDINEIKKIWSMKS